MSRIVDLAAGVIAGASALGAGVLASAPTDYTYPSPDYAGISTMILAGGTALGALGIFITQMVGLRRQTIAADKQKETHDLVNSLSKETKRETAEAAEKALALAKEAAFAEGKLAGSLEERAARAPPAAQMPQVPVPKE